MNPLKVANNRTAIEPQMSRDTIRKKKWETAGRETHRIASCSGQRTVTACGLVYNVGPGRMIADATSYEMDARSADISKETDKSADCCRAFSLSVKLQIVIAPHSQWRCLDYRADIVVNVLRERSGMCGS